MNPRTPHYPPASSETVVTKSGDLCTSIRTGQTEPDASSLQLPEAAKKLAHSALEFSLSKSGVNKPTSSTPASAGRADVFGLIEALPAMGLRRTFVREGSSHKNMLRREKRGYCTVHPDLREFRSFLRVLLPIIGPHPGGNETLERVNNDDREYAPGKVIWADKRQQTRNRSITRMAAPQGARKVPLAEAAAKRGLSLDTVYKRLQRGWSEHEALNTARGVRRARRGGPLEVEPTARPRAAARLRTSSSRRGSGARLDTLWRAWCAAWADTFRDAPPPLPWGKRERGQMLHLADRTERMRTDLPDFIQHAVSRWRDIPSQLGWTHVSSYPAYPTPGYLLRHLHRFWDTYAERLERRAKERGAMAKNAEYRRMLASGMSHDEAILEIGIARARAEERAKLDKQRDELARVYRALEAERQRLRGQPRPIARPNRPQRPEPPALVKHGDNPWDKDGPVEIDDFSDLTPEV